MRARHEFPKQVRAAAFLRAAGHCERCTAKLMAGGYHYDHVLPDALGGEPTLSNCMVLCKACHGEKTARQDVPQIAKADRVREKHFGMRPPSRFWRHPTLKRKINGTVVAR